MKCAWVIGMVAVLMGARAISQNAAQQSPMFPFVLPWNDASPGITNLAATHDAPAGKHGHIRAGAGGHLYAGSKRIRFFGVDIAFSADFPTHADADQIAARLARFGVNIVRFHIMDMQHYPNGILMRDAKDTRRFDPEGLDRLDYFVSRLQKRGVYADLNLLNYRPLTSADGLPAAVDSMVADNYQPRHALGFFDTRVVDLQKEYARNLLTHRNAYTGRRYVDDPGVAIVEVNNENGMLHAWLSGWFDALPGVFAKELQSRWDGWLRGRYTTDDRLRQAWAMKAEPLGAEVLAPAAATEWASWQLQQNAGAEATMAPDDDVPEAVKTGYPGTQSARITSLKRGRESWHLLLNRPGFGVTAGRAYTVGFWAKADAPSSLSVSVYQTAAPYGSLGLNTPIRLGPAWQYYRFTFTANATDEHARVTFGDFASRLGSYRLAGVSLKPGRPPALAGDESLASESIPAFTLASYGERSAQAQADWRRFLWETEDAYWQTMYRYLKRDLGLKSLVIGTAESCSTPVMQSGLDIVDNHAYWQHPQFPGRPWDPDDWIVAHRSMVNERGGILADLAIGRVQGKPRAVTEYCHPAPNGYGVEGYLLYAAYAALQDWDYISMSRYAQQNDWDLRRMRGWFDIDQHPAKMATLLPAVAMFARGDVRAARQAVVVPLDRDGELRLLDGASPWQIIDVSKLGMKPDTALVHRVAVAASRPGAKPTGSPGSSALSGSSTARQPDSYLSDTGELRWDLSVPGRGVVTVNTAQSKAVIGWGGGRRFDLGGVTVEPGPTLQDGWSAITLTAMTGRLNAGPARALITATGMVENTNMRWKSADHTSVGDQWGTAPTLCEGIPARITLPAPAKRVRVWALDERGQRRAPVPVTANGARRSAIHIGPEWRTIWYEVEVL